MLCDVLIVDLNLPGEDGLSLVARLKKVHPRLRIIMMTTRSKIKDRVIGYDTGADIYLTKPIMEEELIATLNALARQIDASKNTLDYVGEDFLLICPKKLTIRGPQGVLSITNSEAGLLLALAAAPKQTLEHWQLLEALDLNVDSNGKTALAVRVTRLRSKLIQIGFNISSIKSLRRSGYKLCIQVSIL